MESFKLLTGKRKPRAALGKPRCLSTRGRCSTSLNVLNPTANERDYRGRGARDTEISLPNSRAPVHFAMDTVSLE